MNKILLALITGAIMFATGCQSEGPEKKGNSKSEWELTRRIELTDNDKGVLTGMIDFSHQLMTKSCELSESGQFCVSPVSVSILLSMLANGAAGELHRDILEVRGSEDVEALNSMCVKLMHYLPCYQNGSSLIVANNIWVADRYSVPDAFEATLANVFNAGVDYVDFKRESTIATINNWVCNNTQGKIPVILDGNWTEYADRDMVAANSVYFKGDWSKEFPADSTRNQVFHGLTGDQEIKMMHRRLSAKFAFDDTLYMLKLDFKESNNSMYLFMPVDGREDMTMAELTSYLTQELHQHLIASAETYRVFLGMPKFSVQSQTSMRRVLDELGLSALHNADMSNMGLGQTALDIIHRTSLKVDEKGTELAAVTAVEGSTANISLADKEVYIDFDRPFLYMIVNGKTGAILMAGTVTDF